MIKYFLYPNTFELESGAKLDQVKIAYSIYGNPDADNTVWVCHALSGNSLVPEWWGGLFGDGRLFDFQNYRVVCANVIGSCYGSTGADDLDNPSDFPIITVKDIVKGLALLRDHLNISEIDILIGASLGGQQALEWAISESDRIKQLILVATNAVHSPLGKAFNEAQRLALKADPTFAQKGQGKAGLKAARSIAMLSYRSYEDFLIKQSDDESSIDGYKAASYLRYQGEKFLDRFKAGAYYTLTKTMDSHDVSRGRDSVEDALNQITARTLVIGVNSDRLFPFSEQEYLFDHIEKAELGVIDSKHGHDAFLIEYDQLQNLIAEFLFNDFKGFKPTVFKTINKK
jgi:homoserine O-acetyltransferase